MPTTTVSKGTYVRDAKAAVEIGSLETAKARAMAEAVFENGKGEKRPGAGVLGAKRGDLAPVGAGSQAGRRVPARRALLRASDASTGPHKSRFRGNATHPPRPLTRGLFFISLSERRIGLPFGPLNTDVDTQAGVDQNRPLSGGVSCFPSSSACERVGRDRPIHTWPANPREEVP